MTVADSIATQSPNWNFFDLGKNLVLGLIFWYRDASAVMQNHNHRRQSL